MGGLLDLGTVTFGGSKKVSPSFPTVSPHGNNYPLFLSSRGNNFLHFHKKSIEIHKKFKILEMFEILEAEIIVFHAEKRWNYRISTIFSQTTSTSISPF